MDNNLPDDYQGNGAHLPWNEPEEVECPECGSSMTETNSATSTWLQCDECEYQTRETKDYE